MNNNKKESGASAFVSMLQNKSSGVSIVDLDEALSGLVRAVALNGAAGSLTYKIKIAPNSHRGVKVSDEIVVKEPSPKQGDSFFFASESGVLSVNDPMQMQIPFKDPVAERAASAAAGAAGPRDVGVAA